MPPPRRLFPLCLLAFSAWTTTARAADPTADAKSDRDKKARCGASYEQAQVLRRSEDLNAARAQLLICKDTCPSELANDCTRWLDDVARLLPTLKVSARNPAGNLLEGTQVSVDGRAVRREDPTSVDPSGALIVSPGKHVVRFERVGSVTAEIPIAVHAGERNHAVDVVLQDVSTRAPLDPPLERSKAPAIVSFALGGALLAAGGALAIKGQVDRSNLKDSCAPFCDESQVDSIRTMRWIAGGLAVAGAGAVIAGILLLPRSSESDSAQRSRVQPRVVVGVAPRAMTLTIRFP